MKSYWPVIFFVMFFIVSVTCPTLAQMDDMEKEFFEEVAKMEEDYKRFEKEAFEEFQREVKAMWGDFVASTKKDWVEYSEDKTGRSRVDFEAGEVLVEVVIPKVELDRDPGSLDKKLTEEIERLIVDKGKNRDYDLPPKPAKDKKIPPSPLLTSPVLKGQLKDKKGNPVTEKNKKEFAMEIVKTEPVIKKDVKTDKGEMVRVQVKFSLIPDHIRIRAERYLDNVRRQAEKFSISVPLAFAVIHTESYFNPKATSPVPAYGLMQLVPKSGAWDAYKYVYGYGKELPPDYLYDSDNNIELGCAYLGLIKNRYFRKVRHADNALYCAIASYNTGAGNLSRALCGNKQLSCAVDKVNSMKPDELYVYLRKNLHHQETRDYLKRVSERMKLYKEWE
ncbi:MAG: murein transglycosylase domain-containing protein [Desulfobacteraceae bacterium]|nr:murein transglycosylase domain-containing protein [Desulfobacteraceae bacterium]